MFRLIRDGELLGYVSYVRPTLPTVGIGVAFVLLDGSEWAPSRDAWKSGTFRVIVD